MLEVKNRNLSLAEAAKVLGVHHIRLLSVLKTHDRFGSQDQQGCWWVTDLPALAEFLELKDLPATEKNGDDSNGNLSAFISFLKHNEKLRLRKALLGIDPILEAFIFTKSLADELDAAQQAAKQAVKPLVSSDEEALRIIYPGK